MRLVARVIDTCLVGTRSGTDAQAEWMRQAPAPRTGLTIDDEGSRSTRRSLRSARRGQGCRADLDKTNRTWTIALGLRSARPAVLGDQAL